MKLNILLSFCVVALLSLDTIHAKPLEGIELDEEATGAANEKKYIKEGTRYYLPTKFICSVYVLVDKTFMDEYRTRAAALGILNDIIELSKVLLEEKSLVTSFEFHVVAKNKIDSSLSLTGKGLEVVRNISEASTVNANIYMYITKYPGHGPKGYRSRVGKICDWDKKQRSAIIGFFPDRNRTVTVQLTAEMFVHEIGHLLGMQDDYTAWGTKRHCATSNHELMGWDKIRDKWSECSVTDFLNYFYFNGGKQGSFCLKHEGSVSLCVDRVPYHLCSASRDGGRCNMFSHFNGCRRTCQKCY